ncbi:MAG: response regulator [Candidatus Sumerlaeia bacterium]|nr:response regulator [Candidatus Sumerlaeia bacterium]
MALILVIDDEEAVRRVIVRTLKSAGHEVVEAENGEKGLALVRTIPPPVLIITDILMPRKDGLETIMEIIRECPEARIIAISGGGAAGHMEYLTIAERLGAIATLAKPFRAEELLDAVSTALAD